jgi:iron(III) transport system substrate-binding protein
MMASTTAWRIAALGLALALGALATGGEALAQKTRVTVYTALENDQLGPYKQALEADNPTLDVVWVRDSTGVITARFLAEKDNPRADIVWGLAASSLALFDQAGLLEPYTPPAAKDLKPTFKSGKTPDTWIGMDAFLAVVCFNTAEAGKTGAPKPASWADLTKPAYKGQVVMPHPASSGTGYLTIAAWLQVMGEAEGWKFMDALHENIGVYTHSGSKPAKMAAAGEYPIGISFDYRVATEKTKGAPVEVIFPSEGLGWDMEASAIIKGTKKLEAAKTLLDWSVSKKAMEMYNTGYAIVAMPGVAKPVENLPADLEAKLINNDFGWAASNRDAILKEWQGRYDSKSEPKS